MSIFDDLSDLMPDSVQIRPRIGELNGDPRYGSYVTYVPCQVFEGLVRYRDDNGDLVSANGQIIIAPTPTVTGDSQVKFSDNRLATVKAVRNYPDETGRCFQLVYLA